MKVNIFIPTKSGGKFTDYSMAHSSITGETVNGPTAPEDVIINEIDESRMTSDKLLATRFLSFLSTRHMTIWSVKNLPRKEQARLKREFNDT